MVLQKTNDPEPAQESAGEAQESAGKAEVQATDSPLVAIKRDFTDPRRSHAAEQEKHLQQWRAWWNGKFH